MPHFFSKIFSFTKELETLGIKYNIALIPFFNESKTLPSFPAFVDKIKSCKRCEIALHVKKISEPKLWYGSTNGY